MSSSGPPELPWLTAASVWMTSSIVNPAGCGDASLLGGDDAGGDRVLKPQRISQGEHRAAHAHAVGVAERQRVGVELGGVDTRQREIVREIASHDIGRQERVLVGADEDLARTLHDVRGGDDGAFVVEDEAGAGRYALPAYGTERGALLAHDRGLYEHHAVA